MLAAYPAAAAAKDTAGITALHFALAKKHPPEVVTAVLAAHPAAAAASTIKNGHLPLHFALDKEHPPEVVAAVLAAYPEAAAIASPTKSGLFPLHAALSHNHPPAVVTAVLAAHPAAAAAKNKHRDFALQCALLYKHPREVITAVLAAHPAAATVDAWTAGAVHQIPRRFTTLEGDVVEVQLSPFYPDDVDAIPDVMPELTAAAAAKLGVMPEDIYIANDRVILYRPTITVSIVVLDADGNRTDTATAPIAVTLATECGPTDNADTVVPTTVRYAVQKVARVVFGLPRWRAQWAIRLHVKNPGGQGFRKLGGRHQVYFLPQAGITDGMMLGVKPRTKGCFGRRVELEVVVSDSARKASPPQKTQPRHVSMSVV